MKSLLALVLVPAALGAATAASAAITVIGNSSARSCYEAARSSARSTAGIAFCDEALQMHALSADDEVATRVNRGILRATRRDFAGALADYDVALALNPDQPEAWLNKAFATLRVANAAAALPLFDAAIAKRTAEPAMAHYGRAVAYEETGNVRAAYADYVRARELRPGWNEPQEELRRFSVGKRTSLR